MCDPTPLRNWLIAAVATLAVAVAIIVGAAIANGSWWYTYLSPIGMLVAAAVTAGALGMVAMAKSALDTFCACTRGRCAGPCNNLSATLTASMTVLGIQATACATVAAYAWIPGAANPAQWVIIGSLVVQAALIASAIGFFAALVSCAAAPAPPPTGSSSGGLVSPPEDQTPTKPTAPVG